MPAEFQENSAVPVESQKAVVVIMSANPDVSFSYAHATLILDSVPRTEICNATKTLVFKRPSHLIIGLKRLINAMKLDSNKPKKYIEDGLTLTTFPNKQQKRNVRAKYEVNVEHQRAIFQDLMSRPNTMHTAYTANVIVLFKGNDIQQADAKQANTLAYSNSKVITCIWLSSEKWPAAIVGKHKPVYPFVLDLGRSPGSGGWWRQCTHAQLKAVSFKENPNRQSCFNYKRLRLFSIVDAENPKLTGTKANLTKNRN